MQPFAAKKSLGQHFLTNPSIAVKIAETTEIIEGDTVFEIGPGTGMLTRELLRLGARVVALEADIRAVEVLKETFAKEIEIEKLVLVHGDIRTIPISSLSLPQTYKVAANIPYYLSGFLFQALLESEHQPERIVFLVQKEVAERIARSKKESLLSLSIKAYGVPKYVSHVSRGNFAPPPRVDSAILLIYSISKERFVALSEKAFFTVLKEGFKARRKHLLSNLLTFADRETLTSVFQKHHISLSIRGEDLTIETWIKLAEEIDVEKYPHKA